MRALMIALLAMTCPAAAISETDEDQVLIVCEAPKGWSFYADTQPEEADNWKPGGFRKGETIRLIRRKDGSMSVEFRDGGELLRPANDGALISRLPETDAPTFLVNRGGKTLELYTFHIELGKLYWSRHRTGDLLPGVAAFEADCRQGTQA